MNKEFLLEAIGVAVCSKRRGLVGQQMHLTVPP